VTLYQYVLEFQTPPQLTAGTYWAEVFNNSGASTSNFTWVRGTLDATAGVAGVNFCDRSGSVWNHPRLSTWRCESTRAGAGRDLNAWPRATSGYVRCHGSGCRETGAAGAALLRSSVVLGLRRHPGGEPHLSPRWRWGGC
jgi:hypothetical protein